jgi:hypothetical protein
MHSGCDCPGEARTIVLIGAPSGAGKTFFSQEVIAGRIAPLPWLNRDGASMLRCDLKSLPSQLSPNCIYLIECAIQHLDRVLASEQWRRVIDAIGKSQHVVLVTLFVSRGQISKQYLKRIFVLPKRIGPLRRVFRLSKYWRLLLYLFTNQIARGYSDWGRVVQEIQKVAPSRVILVRAERNSDLYTLHTEVVASEHPSEKFASSGGF